MILDNIQNSALYQGVHPKFEAAFAFCKKAMAENLPVGRYELDGTALYAMVQEYNTKLTADAKFEGHRNYIDIQFMVSGAEIMKWADISKMTENVPYNPDKDCQFYAPNEDAAAGTVEAGEYAIFFPHDIHMPCVSLNETPAPVKKIVVKVRV